MLLLEADYLKILTEGAPDDIIEDISLFNTYPNCKSWSINWSTENVDFMSTVGLPAFGPSMIDFDDEEDLIINESHVVIGNNNYGDRIVVIKKTGEFATINHDYNDRIEYMNKDAISLFKCMVFHIKAKKGLASFDSEVEKIDPKAIHEGSWWAKNKPS